MAEEQPGGEWEPAGDEAAEQPSWRPTRRQLNWIVGGVIIAAAIIYLIILGYWLPWTGFDTHTINNQVVREKTLWDWLGLLVVPAVIAAVGLWFNHTQKQTELKTAREHRDQDSELARQEREQDRQLAEERRQQEKEIEEARLREIALQTYLDRMSELLLREGLAKSEEDNPSRDVARARTLTVLRRLQGDADRKAAVLQFLYEADLLHRNNKILSLRGADLSGANLRLAVLEEADLRWVDLHGADLSAAYLSKVNLMVADLRETKMNRADLRGANLTGADLRGADLSWVHMRGAILSGAALSKAYLGGADLRDAGSIDLEQVKAALGWQEAIYDDDFRAQLGLPPADGSQPPAEAETAPPDAAAPAQPEPAAVEPQARAGQPEQQEPEATPSGGMK